MSDLQQFLKGFLLGTCEAVFEEVCAEGRRSWGTRWKTGLENRASELTQSWMVDFDYGFIHHLCFKWTNVSWFQQKDRFWTTIKWVWANIKMLEYDNYQQWQWTHPSFMLLFKTWNHCSIAIKCHIMPETIGLLIHTKSIMKIHIFSGCSELPYQIYQKYPEV